MLFPSYSICVRQQEGYCCIEYAPCSDDNSYSLSHIDATKAKQDETCVTDYVGIDGKKIKLSQCDVGKSNKSMEDVNYIFGGW